MDDDGNNNGGRYLIIRPENGGIRDLFKFLVFADAASGAKFLETSDAYTFHEQLLGGGGDDGGLPPTDHRWVIFVSIIVRKLISVLGKPMEWTGYVVEFVLNLLSLNGNLLGLVYNLFRGKIIMPQRGSETFISTIGHLDERIDLDRSDFFDNMDSAPGGRTKQIDIGNKSLLDLCMMASKLAYENANVVKNVVELHWKMHFVDFYNCWNDFEKEASTQVFILCDKPKDASLILISFRGTEPFDADDWITDFDYSWYEIPELGKVHMGFLEALGLGNRANTATFQELLQVNNTKLPLSNASSPASAILEGKEEKQEDSHQSFEPQEHRRLIPEMVEETAYFAIRSKLKSLLQEHKNAKFMVTGHSLGGALAILFPTILVLHGETELMQRLLGVHSFGQPRIGNKQLSRFMESHLGRPNPRYLRVVYCNDLVPRLPYDDKTFLYKHFGICLYFNSFYVEQKVKEEPNRNYFGLWYLIPEYANAVWELIRSLMMGYTHGPEYKECWEGMLLRLIGLVIPGLSAHSPTDYINSIRLGRDMSISA